LVALLAVADLKVVVRCLTTSLTDRFAGSFETARVLKYKVEAGSSLVRVRDGRSRSLRSTRG